MDSNEAVAIMTRWEPSETVKSLQEFLKALEIWQEKYEPLVGRNGFAGQLWYRGEQRLFPDLRPGVYHDAFTNRARQVKLKEATDIEDKRLHLEREMLSEFRTAGA